MLALVGLKAGSAAQVLQDHTHQQQQEPPSQAPAKKKSSKGGPRALAVLEFLPGGHMRLVPIALWIDDRYYDASLYGANPEPMALEPETVYEATLYGEPTGLFTVTTPEQVKGNWVANGQWKPKAALDDKLAQQKAKQPATKPNAFDVNSDRPVLKRAAGSSDSSSSSASASASNAGTSQSPSDSSAGSSSSPEPSDRPTLKKPASSSTESDTNASASSPPKSSADISVVAASPDESDPNRPVLRRGKPTADTSRAPANDEAADKTTAAIGTAQTKLMSTMASLGRKSYVAVSDAGSHELRSMAYALNTAERTNKSEEMRALALAEIAKFIAQRKTPALPKNATITDYDLRAYDLEFSNSPTLVFSATVPVEGAKALRGGEFDYFVTVVARLDIDDKPIKIFGLVSDSNHLDAFPRLEIIDAVDADANGRGDLLFRQYSDSGINYGLYRVYPYDMQKVFEGGSSM